MCIFGDNPGCHHTYQVVDADRMGLGLDVAMDMTKLLKGRRPDMLGVYGGSACSKLWAAVMAGCAALSRPTERVL